MNLQVSAAAGLNFAAMLLIVLLLLKLAAIKLAGTAFGAGLAFLVL
jgi:hypothetical protein